MTLFPSDETWQRLRGELINDASARASNLDTYLGVEQPRDNDSGYVTYPVHTNRQDSYYTCPSCGQDWRYVSTCRPDGLFHTAKKMSFDPDTVVDGEVAPVVPELEQ